ncbi:MAG TPA: hypothetical protein ENN25_01605 [Euryarchaeota archaeon]|nr:hypothetical protein [Euryarchaeota archaeon]
MRAVQLGCGITGLVCAEHLAKNQKIEELILADSRTEGAEALATRLRSDRVSVRKIDATDESSIRSLLKDGDLVVSSIPGELNRKVVRIAMSAGIDYVDFSLPVNSEEDFSELLRLGERIDSRVLSSMGSDPGISDILAMHGSSKLDRSDRVHVIDGDNACAEGREIFTLWSPLEMIEEATTPAAIFENGEIFMVPPLSRKETYRFPEPIGDLTVYNTLHEETYLIPRFIKTLAYADFKIAIDDNFVEFAEVLRKVGLNGLEPVDVKGVSVRPIDLVAALMPRPVDIIGKVKGHAAVVVEVHGLKDGRQALAKLWVMMSHEEAYEKYHSNATGYLVGAAGATAAEMVIAGEVDEKGFLLPEQVPSDKFIRRLAEKGVKVKEEIHILD